MRKRRRRRRRRRKLWIPNEAVNIHEPLIPYRPLIINNTNSGHNAHSTLFKRDGVDWVHKENRKRESSFLLWHHLDDISAYSVPPRQHRRIIIDSEERVGAHEESERKGRMEERDGEREREKKKFFQIFMEADQISTSPVLTFD